MDVFKPTLKRKITTILQTAEINPMIKTIAMGYILKMTDAQVDTYAPKIVELFDAMNGTPRVVAAVEALGVKIDSAAELINIFRG